MKSAFQVLEYSLVAALGLGIPLLILSIWLKRQAQKRAYARAESMSGEAAELVEGTEAERIAAEKALNFTIAERREELLKTHQLIERFNSLDGYSVEYIDSLVAELRNQDVNTEVMFQETMPMGMAAAIVSAHGNFEIYVERSKVELAAKTIAAFRA